MIEILPGSMADYYTKEGEKIGEQRGERIGEKRGRAEERLETSKTILRGLLKERFGELPAKIARRISVCKDADQLQAEILRIGSNKMASLYELNLKRSAKPKSNAKVKPDQSSK